MVRKSHGFKSRHNRNIFRKNVRLKGNKVPLGRYLQPYEVGNKVDIILDPSVQKGQPHFKYHGKTGTIIEKRGRAYIITLKVGKKDFYLISRPEHMRFRSEI
ncbi:MAG TPA: 50S ribosomal protein L21e [Candidatus Deferrimicrobium sp.]|nr:50S ribosomal protein L21e [Candidatus Deferrimicrobium sp.]